MTPATSPLLSPPSPWFSARRACAFAQTDALTDINQLIKQGQLAQALDRVNTYLATQPNDARGRFLKGLILTEQNNPAEAIKMFTALTEDYPELPEPYNNLAVLYAAQGQYDKARDALEIAIRTHPSYATAHENLGDIYAKMASQAYDKALQIDRGNATAQTKLNLIKELFSTSQPPGKVAMAKAEPALKAPPPAPAAKPPAPARTPAATAAAPTPAPAPAVPAATAAAKPAPAEPAKPASTENADEVLQAVKAWANAWSANDVAGYLAHYAPTFNTPAGSRAANGKRSAKRVSPSRAKSRS